MKVKVDKDVCIGSGNCEAQCPNIFTVVDGTSQVRVNPVPKNEESCAQDAINGCPSGAISIS